MEARMEVNKYKVVVHTYDDVYDTSEPSNDSHYVVEFNTFDSAYNYYKDRGKRKGSNVHIIMTNGEVFNE
jgi:hypothetical protein